MAFELCGPLLFFRDMNQESTSTSTKGGSVPGLTTGVRALPRVTPELLWFEAFTTGAPERAVALPDGDVVFAHRGRVCAMRDEEWRQFEAYARAA